MKINWKFIDNILMGEMETDDISEPCKQELAEFLQTHNFEVFSEQSLFELQGIWNLSIKPAYEAVTGEKIPNIFNVIQGIEEEPEQQEEVIDERETLSSGF